MKKLDNLTKKIMVKRWFWYIILGIETLILYKYQLGDRYVGMTLENALYFISLEVIFYTEVMIRISKIVIRIETYKPDLKEVFDLILKGDTKVP
ncbi:hypothetical protein [Pseudobutyrivibrio sp.]